jgi:Na+-driven multidrug efflux pump
MQSAINSLGADYMAASSAAYNIEMAVYFFINAFGQALTTFVGQHCGAGKYDRCRTVIRRTMLMSWAFTVGLCILMLIAARPALSLFTDDAAVLDIAVTRVKILLYGETFNVIMDNLSGVMRGLGKSFAPALVSVIGVCGVRITWVFTGFKIYHSWVPLMLLFPISWAITAAIIAIIYFKDRKTLLPAE